MDENIELLEYIYKNSEMGIHTITCLLKDLNKLENKIKLILEKELKEYEKYYKKSKNYLDKFDKKLIKNNIMSKIMSSMGIKKEVESDNSDTAIAHMMIEGVTMGIVDIETKIKNYKNVVEDKYIDLAKNYLKTLNSQIEELKKFI